MFRGKKNVLRDVSIIAISDTWNNYLTLKNVFFAKLNLSIFIHFIVNIEKITNIVQHFFFNFTESKIFHFIMDLSEPNVEFIRYRMQKI